MKVLVIGPDLSDPGGVANYYNAVLPHMSGCSIEIEYLQIGSTHGNKSSSRLHPLYDQFALWGAISRYQPDIVHVNPSLDLKSYLRDGAFIFQAKLRRRLVLVFFRGWQLEFANKIKGWLRWFFNRTYANADRFIVLANQFADSLKDWGVTVPIILGTTTVADELLNGFEIDVKIEELKKVDEIRLLYMARLEPEKGILLLLEAVTRLLKQGHNISLTIAGDGPAMHALQQHVGNMDANCDRIHIAGYVRKQQKTALLSSHHIFCFPTKYGEGMPNAVLEAMAFAMPVITTSVGGLADFFQDGRMGILLKNVDVDSLCTAIERAISDRDKLAEISVYNYRYAQDRFLSSICAENLCDSYRQIYGD